MVFRGKNLCHLKDMSTHGAFRQPYTSPPLLDPPLGVPHSDCLPWQRITQLGAGWWLLLGWLCFDKVLQKKLQCMLEWFPVFTLSLWGNNVGKSVWGPSVSQSEVHVQKSCERTKVQSIACSHVQLWYIAIYDNVLKCIILGHSQLIAKKSCAHTPVQNIDNNHVPL